jgi:lysophospholipase L1-like esterase
VIGWRLRMLNSAMKHEVKAFPSTTIWLVLITLAWRWSAPGFSQAVPEYSTLAARSVVSEGDTTRLQRVLAKARRGDEVTIGVIGGSITQGAAATRPENRYGNLVAAWWRETFPKADIKLVNAGIGVTGSNYGALRADRDLLSHHPDLVIAEYAVNDANDRAEAETLEGLARQVLKRTNQPALLLLFTMNQNGGNAQEWQGKVGTHYGLPMISYRDALWPEIEAGRIAWQDISPDAVHPNDRGHAYCAEFITRYLAKVLKELPPDRSLPAVRALPAPCLSDSYEWVELLEAEKLMPVVNQGWTYDSNDKGWKSDQPGSVVEFEVEGRNISTMHYVVRGPMGRAKLRVDGRVAKELDGWFDQTWGGYRQTNEIIRDLEPGKHRVQFELLAEKSAQSTGTEFRILGIGTAGVK